jgi:hypothetical protein
MTAYITLKFSRPSKLEHFSPKKTLVFSQGILGNKTNLISSIQLKIPASKFSPDQIYYSFEIHF